MRAREFLMKDAYSFPSWSPLQQTYDVMRDLLRIFGNAAAWTSAGGALDTGSISGSGSL